MRSPLHRYTVHTVTDPRWIRHRLEEIRRCHIAVDTEERDIGICAVATGFTGPTGALQAISVVMPTARFKSKRDAAIVGLARINRAVSDAAHQTPC
nr:IclR family transcriptional regulator C-terminal domain-containing protein [Nocardia vinacea]